MTKERFDFFCVDLEFDPSAWFNKCVRIRDEPLRAGHFNYSIKRMLVLGERPVCKDMSKFGTALSGKWQRADWRGISLRDFGRTGSAEWGMNTSYVGRAEILDAMEMWGEFQRIFKGDGFASCVGQLRTLWEAADDPIAHYHNVYIHFQMEALICSYYEDIGGHSGEGVHWVVPSPTVAVPAGLCGGVDSAGRGLGHRGGDGGTRGMGARPTRAVLRSGLIFTSDSAEYIFGPQANGKYASGQCSRERDGCQPDKDVVKVVSPMPQGGALLLVVSGEARS